MKHDNDNYNIDLMLKYCSEIEGTINYFGFSLETFLNNRTYQNAISMPLFQIGEVSNRISKELKNKYSNIPWEKIYGMRNRMGHGYDAVDFETIWYAATERVPELKNYLEKISKDLQKNE